MKKEQHLKLLACALALSMSAQAAAPPPDATSGAAVRDHQEDGNPEVFLYTVEGGALEVVVACSACLLDIEVVRWREANGTRVEPVFSANDIVNDVTDGARIELPEIGWKSACSRGARHAPQ